MSALGRLWKRNSRSGRERDPRNMSGIQFEHYCADVLEDCGWKITPTPGSREGGVDLIARKPKLCVAIQCKQRNAPVGIGAVQEAHFGKGQVSADFAAVISSRGFTSDARRRAETARVILLPFTEIGALEDRIQQLKPHSAPNWLAIGAGAFLLLLAAANIPLSLNMPLATRVLVDPQSGLFWFPRCISQQDAYKLVAVQLGYAERHGYRLAASCHRPQTSLLTWIAAEFTAGVNGTR